MTTKQEASWVLQAQFGDRQALESLLGSVQPALTRYLRALIGPVHADDVTQDVLVIVYRKLWWLNSPDLFRPWLFRIASREAVRLLKKERRWPEHLRDDDALEAVPAPSPPPTTEAIEELLKDAGLTPASRAVLVLHFQEGMTLQDAAAVLELPLGTVKSRLAYGLAALRRSTGGLNDRRR